MLPLLARLVGLNPKLADSAAWKEANVSLAPSSASRGRESFAPKRSGAKHFRARSIPMDWSKEDLQLSLLASYNGTDPNEVKVFSLAPYIDLERGNFWMAATVASDHISNQLTEGENKTFTLVHLDVQHEILLDTHFEGLTPYCPETPDSNSIDCIAIPGLAGNAYGSWLSPDKSYMWLRDTLGSIFPQLRVWTYGYNTKLGSIKSSDSHEIACHLRRTLHRKFMREREHGQQARPLIFVFHSLGGLVFRDMLVEEDEDNTSTKELLYYTRGALNFGAPFGGWQNQELVKTVHQGETIYTLAKLDPNVAVYQRQRATERFVKAFPFPDAEIYTFAEKLPSPIYTWDQDGRGIIDDGKREILVTYESATSGRPQDRDRNERFNKDHNELAKLSPGSEEHESVVVVLDLLLKNAKHAIETRHETLANKLVAQHIRQHEPGSVTSQLLCLLSFLEGTSISIDLLYAGAKHLQRIPKTLRYSEPQQPQPLHKLQVPRSIIDTLSVVAVRERSLQELRSMLLRREQDDRFSDTVVMVDVYQNSVQDALTHASFLEGFEVALAFICAALVSGYDTPISTFAGHVKRLYALLGTRTFCVPSKESQVVLAYMISVIAQSEQDEIRFYEARDLFRKAEGLYTKGYGFSHPDTLRICSSLAVIHHQLRHRDDAQKAFEKILRIRTKLGNNTLGTIGARRDLANFFYECSRSEDLVQANDLRRARKEITRVIESLKNRTDYENVEEERSKSEELRRMIYEQLSHEPQTTFIARCWRPHRNAHRRSS